MGVTAFYVIWQGLFEQLWYLNLMAPLVLKKLFEKVATAYR